MKITLTMKNEESLDSASSSDSDDDDDASTSSSIFSDSKKDGSAQVLHSCTDCKRVFSRKDNLTQHLKRKFEEVDSDSDEAWKRAWKRQRKEIKEAAFTITEDQKEEDGSCSRSCIIMSLVPSKKEKTRKKMMMMMKC